jgi:cytochrome oxidase Cu insertion factor (SCO1/SenC/PrrC family)
MKAKVLTTKRSQANNPVVKQYVKAASIHVTPKGDDWQVKKSEATKATRIFKTQTLALEKAREIAKKHESELFLHGKNGKIREKTSYGKDKFPPRG